MSKPRALSWCSKSEPLLKLRSRKCVMISLIYLTHRNILIRNCNWSKKMKNIFLKHIFFSLKIRELSEKTGPEAWKRLWRVEWHPQRLFLPVFFSRISNAIQSTRT